MHDPFFARKHVLLLSRARCAIRAATRTGPPGFTCIAVPSPIVGLGAKPVYVDIDPATYNLDPADLARKVCKRSRAIIAQHTFGIPCDMNALMTIANKHGLPVIEDACHVWGAKYNGRDLGTLGVAAFYSYDPGKPFIIGMGGAATVNTRELREKMQSLRSEFKNPLVSETAKLHLQYVAHRLTKHPRLYWRVRDLYRSLSKTGIAIATWTADSLEGKLDSDYHKTLSPSLKSRLLAHMAKGDRVIARHKRLTNHYEAGLCALGSPEPHVDPNAEPVFICYPLQVAAKARLLSEARKNSVEMGDWFSSPVHPLPEQEWEAVGYAKGACPVAEAVSQRVVTLPCHSGVTHREANRTLGFLARMKREGIFELASAQPQSVTAECGLQHQVKTASAGVTN